MRENGNELQSHPLQSTATDKFNMNYSEYRDYVNLALVCDYNWIERWLKSETKTSSLKRRALWTLSRLMILKRTQAQGRRGLYLLGYSPLRMTVNSRIQ